MKIATIITNRRCLGERLANESITSSGFTIIPFYIINNANDFLALSFANMV